MITNELFVVPWDEHIVDQNEKERVITTSVITTPCDTSSDTTDTISATNEENLELEMEGILPLDSAPPVNIDGAVEVVLDTTTNDTATPVEDQIQFPVSVPSLDKDLARNDGMVDLMNQNDCYSKSDCIDNMDLNYTRCCNNNGKPVDQNTSNELNDQIILKAKQILNNLKETRYSHTTNIDETIGKYYVDCSGLVFHILRKIAPIALFNIPIRRGKIKPQAIGFHKVFASSPQLYSSHHGDSAINVSSSKNYSKGWLNIPNLLDSKPGDFIAWRKESIIDGENTGHIVIVCEKPTLESTNNSSGGRVKVRVIDSTSYIHADDTRSSSRSRFGASRSGVGCGTMWFNINLDKKNSDVAYGHPTAIYNCHRTVIPITGCRISIGRCVVANVPESPLLLLHETDSINSNSDDNDIIYQTTDQNHYYNHIIQKKNPRYDGTIVKYTNQLGYAYLHNAKSSQIKELGSQYCTVDPDNPCLPYGLKENTAIRIYHHHNQIEKSAIFKIKYHNELPSSWLRIRMSAEGRKRLGYSKTFKPTGKEKLIIENISNQSHHHHDDNIEQSDNTQNIHDDSNVQHQIKATATPSLIQLQERTTLKLFLTIIEGEEEQKDPYNNHNNVDDDHLNTELSHAHIIIDECRTSFANPKDYHYPHSTKKSIASYKWTQIEGPGVTTFIEMQINNNDSVERSMVTTFASFSKPGIYRLVATDVVLFGVMESQRIVSNEVTVTVVEEDISSLPLSQPIRRGGNYVNKETNIISLQNATEKVSSVPVFFKMGMPDTNISTLSNNGIKVDGKPVLTDINDSPPKQESIPLSEELPEEKCLHKTTRNTTDKGEQQPFKVDKASFGSNLLAVAHARNNIQQREAGIDDGGGTNEDNAIAHLHEISSGWTQEDPKNKMQNNNNFSVFKHETTKGRQCAPERLQVASQEEEREKEKKKENESYFSKMIYKGGGENNYISSDFDPFSFLRW